MIKYKNNLEFEKKFNVNGVDLYGNGYYAKEQRIATLISRFNGEVIKFLQLIISSATDIDLDVYDSDISIEVYDKDEITNRFPEEVLFLFNPDEGLVELLKDFRQIIIPAKFTNSKSDIIISKTLYINDDIAISISGIKLEKDVRTLKIEVGPDGFANVEDYYRLLDLYRKFERLTKYSQIMECETLDSTIELKRIK